MNDEETTKVYNFENDLEESKEDIVEETSNEEIKEEPKKKKKEKKSLKEKWNSLSKKKKIIIIIAISLFLVLLTVGIILIVKHNNKPSKKIEKVVVENQNYRYENGVLYFYNKSKKVIGNYKCKNKNEKKCYVAYYSLDEDVDNTKYIYEDEKPVLFQTPIINEKYAFIYDNASKKEEVITLYNFKDKKKEEIFTDLKKAYNDYVYIVKNDEGKYGAISLKDDYSVLVKHEYEYLGNYDASSEEVFIAKENEKYFLINKEGEQISTPINNRICGYNGNYIKSKNDSSYVVYDYKGNVLIDSISFASFLDKYIFVVRDNMIYVYDNNRNKLNYDGIAIYNDNYIRKYIYDKKKKLIEITNSYEVELDENNINIKVYKDKEEIVTTINALEGAVNSKLAYISYVGGKLLFYSDSEKQNLIGTYNCKNKNNITSEDSKLTNCNIATEKDKNVPIINSRYTFINDTLDSSNPSIYLYDLKESKGLGNYLAVETNIKDNTMFYTTSDLNIIALSAKKNKYGIIKIGNDSVKKIVEFENNKITVNEDYYFVNKSSGTYSVYDNNGKSLTSEFANEITDYDQTRDLVMTTSNNKFKLFKSSGKEITSKFYEHIDLYKDYIVAIDSMKLDVIDYEGKSYCTKCKDVKIYNSDYQTAYNIDNEKLIIYNNDTALEPIMFKEEV